VRSNEKNLKKTLRSSSSKRIGNVVYRQKKGIKMRLRRGEEKRKNLVEN
jgi:hypothetical protein